MFYTFHDFMMHSKGVTYILMGLVLLGMIGVWSYLMGRDEDKDEFSDVHHGSEH